MSKAADALLPADDLLKIVSLSIIVMIIFRLLKASTKINRLNSLLDRINIQSVSHMKG